MNYKENKLQIHIIQLIFLNSPLTETRTSRRIIRCVSVSNTSVIFTTFGWLVLRHIWTSLRQDCCKMQKDKCKSLGKHSNLRRFIIKKATTIYLVVRANACLFNNFRSIFFSVVFCWGEIDIATSTTSQFFRYDVLRSKFGGKFEVEIDPMKILGHKGENYKAE